MTELAEPWHEVTNADDAPGERQNGAFVSFIDGLQQESERLQSLAEACAAAGLEIAERDRHLHHREQALVGGQQELDSRREELERWQQELDRRAAELEQANGRIVEAAEREAALRALAHDVLKRYSDPSNHG